MYDTSKINDELKVCHYPKEVKAVLDEMGQYMNFFKIERSVDVGKVLGYNGTNWVLADINDPSTLNYLHVVFDKDGQYVYISNYCTLSTKGDGFAYLGGDGSIVFEEPENPIRLGFATEGKLFFMGR